MQDSVDDLSPGVLATHLANWVIPSLASGLGARDQGVLWKNLWRPGPRRSTRKRNQSRQHRHWRGNRLRSKSLSLF